MYSSPTKIIKLTPHEKYPFIYTTDETEPRTVSFEQCTLGKYKGKTFMIERPITNDGTHDCVRIGNAYKVLNELKFHIHSNGTTRILEKVEICVQPYAYKSVFFSVARKSKFGIVDVESMAEGFPGYTFNRHWNGWEMPMFTKDVAEQIAKASTVKYSDDEIYECYYNAKRDCYMYKDPNEINPQVVAEGMIISTEDGEIKVYDFGISGWIWDEICE